MKLIGILVLSLCALISVTCAQSKLPLIQVGDKQLYFHTGYLNWYQAFQFCARNQMQLLTINTSLENYYIGEYLKSNNIKILLWTSGTDLGKEGEWMWMTSGLPFAYNGFYAPNPDNNNLGNVCGTQDCLAVTLSGNCIYWDDYICTREFRFFCETII